LGRDEEKQKQKQKQKQKRKANWTGGLDRPANGPWIQSRPDVKKASLQAINLNVDGNGIDSMGSLSLSKFSQA
jgi:hypothetical protein